jgi:hypothetical protein
MIRIVTAAFSRVDRHWSTGLVVNGYVLLMAAVVLQGPANSAPKVIIGPFGSLRDAENWAIEHPRAGGYSVAQELTTAAEFAAASDEERP